MSEGDIVKYRGKLYFFEPFGNSCFLYDKEDEIGRPYLKQFEVGLTQVYRPTQEELAAFYKERGIRCCDG